VDIRADIYSLGATLYFLLTGKSPVGDGTLTQKLIRHQIRRVPSVREVRPDVPAALETVLEKMLAKEPGNRYRTPIEVADALLPWTQKPVPPPSPEEMPPVSAEARRAEASSRAPDVTRPMAASSAHAARSSLARAAVGAALPAARKAKPHGLLVAVVLTFILGGTAVAGGLYLLGVPLWDPVPAFTPTGFHPYLLRQLTGHDAGVDRVAVLPDGVSALSVGFDHTVRLWDLDKPALLHVFRDHTAPVRFVCADPTGPRAATGSGDGTVRIWDLKERKLIRTLNSHGGTVWAVGFSPDGKRLASAGDDRKIRLWDTNSGELIKEMTGHSDNINWLVYMPNGKQVATFSWDKTARLWDLESGKDIRKFVAHTARITCGAVTADGKRLATGGDDKIVRVWDPNTGRLEWEQEGPGGLWALAFTPDGRVLAGAGPEKQIRTYDVAAGRVITTWTAHPNGAVAGLSWRLDSQQLVSASHDKTLCVWQAAAAPPKSPWAVVREVAGPVTPPGRARRAGRPSPRCPGAPTNRRRVPRRGRRAVGN
jgi:hypothetical protein